MASQRPSPSRRRRRRQSWIVVLVLIILGFAAGPVLATFFGPIAGQIIAPPSDGATRAEACRVTEITDGDTIRMRCQGRSEERVRLTGFDTPELFSPGCASEHRAARRAKSALSAHIAAAGELAFVRQGTDRYGRTLADLRLDGTSAADLMIASGHARAYDGGRRAGWC